MPVKAVLPLVKLVLLGLRRFKRLPAPVGVILAEPRRGAQQREGRVWRHGVVHPLHIRPFIPDRAGFAAQFHAPALVSLAQRGLIDGHLPIGAAQDAATGIFIQAQRFSGLRQSLLRRHAPDGRLAISGLLIQPFAGPGRGQGLDILPQFGPGFHIPALPRAFPLLQDEQHVGDRFGLLQQLLIRPLTAFNPLAAAAKLYAVNKPSRRLAVFKLPFGPVQVVIRRPVVPAVHEPYIDVPPVAAFSGQVNAVFFLQRAGGKGGGLSLGHIVLPGQQVRVDGRFTDLGAGFAVHVLFLQRPVRQVFAKGAFADGPDGFGLPVAVAGLEGPHDLPVFIQRNAVFIQGTQQLGQFFMAVNAGLPVFQGQRHGHLLQYLPGRKQRGRHRRCGDQQQDRRQHQAQGQPSPCPLACHGPVRNDAALVSRGLQRRQRTVNGIFNALLQQHILHCASPPARLRRSISSARFNRLPAVDLEMPSTSAAASSVKLE